MIDLAAFRALAPRWRAVCLAAATLIATLAAGHALAAPVKLMTLTASLPTGDTLAYDQSFAPQLEKALRQAGHDVTIVDVSVAGETTQEARARLGWILAEPIDGIILEMGANDAAEHRAPDDIAFDLGELMRGLRAHKVPMLLAGARAPDPSDTAYADAYQEIFPRLAIQYDTIFYSALLDGVSGDRDLMQSDGVHPNSEGIARIVQSILPAVEALIAPIENPRGQ